MMSTVDNSTHDAKQAPEPLVPPTTTRTWIIVALLVLAIFVAMPFDRATAQAVADCGIDDWLAAHKTVRTITKFSGEFTLLLAAAAWVAWRHPSTWRGAVFLIGGALISSLNGLVKWIVGRTRPFKLFDVNDVSYLAPFEFQPFRGGLPGLFVGKNLSFPSGHAALAFAAATGLAMLWPRWRWFFFTAATVTGVERVLENAHYFSDVVAAVAMGVGGVCVIRRMLRSFLSTVESRGLPVIEQ